MGARANEIDAELAKISDTVTKINTNGIINSFGVKCMTQLDCTCPVYLAIDDTIYLTCCHPRKATLLLREQQDLDKEYRAGQTQCLGYI